MPIAEIIAMIAGTIACIGILLLLVYMLTMIWDYQNWELQERIMQIGITCLIVGGGIFLFCTPFLTIHFTRCR